MLLSQTTIIWQDSVYHPPIALYVRFRLQFKAITNSLWTTWINRQNTHFSPWEYWSVSVSSNQSPPLSWIQRKRKWDLKWEKEIEGKYPGLSQEWLTSSYYL